MASYSAQNPGANGGGYHRYKGTITINEIGVDEENNRSTVRVNFVLGRGDYSDGTSYNNNGCSWSLLVNDTTYSGTTAYNFRNGNSFTLKGNTDIVIPHNADGTKTIKVRGYISDTGTTLGSWYIPDSSGANFALTTIARNPLLGLKKSGAWLWGKVRIKISGIWRNAKKIFVKKSGVWVEDSKKG